MFTTILTLTRNGTTLAQHIPNCQVDENDGKTVFVNGQAFTMFELGIDYIINVTYLPNSLVKQDDVLVDELKTDPDTGAFYRYHVARRPKTYDGDRQTLYCKVVPGT